MKRRLAVLLSLPIVGTVVAQEVVTPLTVPLSDDRPSRLQLDTDRPVDSSFIYTYDTVAITAVWDDFSTDKFVRYPPSYTAPNVTPQTYYRLMDTTNTFPEPPTVRYCDKAHARHDTVFVNGGEATVTTTYFSPHPLWVNKLDAYPIEGQIEVLYDECYTLIDSVIDGVLDPTQDTLWHSGSPDFTQDSATVFSAFMNDPRRIWTDNDVFRNDHFAVDPWSLGVATLDGVDASGWPYDFDDESAYGDADYLTSKPIDLAGTSNVYLQFLYQAKGYGNMPEEQDSLLVDFWSVKRQQWYRSWSVPTLPVPDRWDTAYISVPVDDLDKGFRFRIHNKASTSGALDHWHIDYVQLYENPLLVPQSYKDLAIAYPLHSLLKDYTAVPWEHYNRLDDPKEKMLANGFLQVHNSDVDPTNVGVTSMFLNIQYDGATVLNHPLPNPGAVPPWTGNWELATNQFPFSVPPNYTYAALGNDTMATFEVTINVAADVAAANVHPVNDTASFQQVFKNYYAYDDGSAEAGYGIQGSNALMAYAFTAYEPDTLMGVFMHFLPTVVDVSGRILLLTVWGDKDGQPGEILYQDDFFTPHYPQYGGSKNAFAFYSFTNPDYPSRIAVPSKFYVGWEQIDSQSLNVGMDRNTDSGTSIWYNFDGSWMTSAQRGSLMIRPVFSTAIDYTLGAVPVAHPPKEAVRCYPNPVANTLHFDGLQAGDAVHLYTLQGREIAVQQHGSQISTQTLARGVYVVTVENEAGAVLFSDKLIKQ